MQPRHPERLILPEPITVRDAGRDCPLGEALNLSIEGLMVAGDEPVAEGAILQIALELPWPIGGASEIELGVTCLWSRPAADGPRHWAGLQIIDASVQAIKRIEVLLREFRQ